MTCRLLPQTNLRRSRLRGRVRTNARWVGTTTIQNQPRRGGAKMAHRFGAGSRGGNWNQFRTDDRSLHTPHFVRVTELPRQPASAARGDLARYPPPRKIFQTVLHPSSHSLGQPPSVRIHQCSNPSLTCECTHCCVAALLHLSDCFCARERRPLTSGSFSAISRPTCE